MNRVRSEETGSGAEGVRQGASPKDGPAGHRRRWRGVALAFGLALIAVAGLAGGCGLTRRPHVVERVEDVTASRLRESLAALLEIGPRPMGDDEATDATLAFFRTRLESYGYEVVQREVRFDIEPAEEGRFLRTSAEGEHRVVNLFAELRGTEEPDRVLDLGAHYDSVPGSPGADDNGTGVIGVLEVARILAGYEPKRTVRFCFFGGEEAGLIGSHFHVASFEQDPRREEGIFVLEMIGYASSEPDSQDAPIRVPLIASLPYVGDFILVVGNMASGGLGNLFEHSIDAYTPELPYYSANRIGGFFADAARSDHSPYWASGYRGVMITDTANFRNPNYHRHTDTLETVDFEFMERVVRAAAAAVVHWADDDD